MPDNIPIRWTPETPGKRTLDDLKNGLSGCAGGSAKVVKDTWQYTTWTEDVYNWWIAGLWSSRDTVQNRKFSVGTAIRIYFYCFDDVDLHESQNIIVSKTYAVKDCVFTITDIIQEQKKFKRTWARWTLTAVFKDDSSSTKMDAIVGSGLSLLGIPVTGIANVVVGALGAITSWVPLLEKAESILIRKESADGGEVWINQGMPSSTLEKQERIPEDLCKWMTDAFTPPITVAGPAH